MSESKTPCKHGAITTWMTDDGMPTMWSCVACNHKFVPIAQLLQAESDRDALAARVAELEAENVEPIRRKFEVHAGLTVRQSFQWPDPPYDYMEPDVQRRFEAYAALSRESQS